MADARPADKGVVVSRYLQSDRAALLAFRREHYAAGAVQAEPAYVDWQFRDAPGIADLGAPLHVAWMEGRIIGTNATIRTSLHVEGRSLPAAWGIDFAVRKDLRRRGIGEALSAASRAEPSVRLVIEDSAAARGILLRAGYRVIGDVPLFVRPLDPARWLQHSVPAAVARVLGAALPALAALEALALRSARRQRMELVETSAFDERADQLFANLSRRYPVLCRRDRRWLEWRFERYPQAGRYHLCWLMRDGAAVGYAVLRAATHRGAPSGVLVDHLCAPEHLRTLLGLCLARFRKAGAAVATCLQLHPSAAGAFRAAGFVRRRSGWQLLVRAHPAIETPSIFDPANWFLTGGDANVDRRSGPALAPG